MTTKDSTTDNELLGMWNEIRQLVDDIDVDALKNANGVASAGVRLRKGLRLLKAKASKLVKLSVEKGKAEHAKK
jgi:hypothetical protein